MLLHRTLDVSASVALMVLLISGIITAVARVVVYADDFAVVLVRRASAKAVPVAAC